MEGGQSLGCQRPSEASVSPTCTWRRAVALLPRLGGVRGKQYQAPAEPFLF